MVTMIAAAAENNALGKENDLLWRLPDDFKRFKKLTSNHPIIMGRKTFESFDGLLPNRTHFVITRNEDYDPGKGVYVVKSLSLALKIAQDLDPNPFIIGGGEIYKMGLERTDKIELTRVHESFEDADTFFPEIDEEEWKLTEEVFHEKDEKHKYSFSYLTYERK